MKKGIILIIVAVILSSGAAQSKTKFGLVAGLSTPNDNVNDVYNGTPSSLSQVGNLFREGAATGYHIGAKLRYQISDNVDLHGGVALHRFPESEIIVYDPDYPEDKENALAVLKTTQNYIPITAGINFFLMRELIGVYGVGELSYNLMSSSVDVVHDGQDIPVQFDEPSDSRVGVGIGAGIDIDIKILTGNIEAKYNIANLIGKEDDEETKAYFSLSFGVYF